MKTHRKLVSLLLALCLLLGMSGNAFAESYTGESVVPGLSEIQPGDDLTLPDNTIWATLTAMWGVEVIFEDWDNTELKSETVAVSDKKPGSSKTPKNDPTRDGWMFTGWERVDQNGDTNVTLSDDGKVKNITGPGPIIYKATYAENHDISDDTGSALIPFTKTWTGGSDAVRPASITVNLYKYLGDTFDASTATLVESKTLTAADNWKYTFDISNESLYSGTSYSSSTAYKWAVVEDEVAGYTETEHTDPSVIFNPPEVAGSGWNRITPCSEINITTSGNDKSIVCAKKGNSAVIWSVDPLSQAEREMIQNSARSGIDGASGIKNFNFISGFGTSSPYGLTVTETQIKFNKPSDWSFYATGVYNKSSTQTNASSITNSYAPEAAIFAIPVTKVIEGTPTAASSFEFTLTPITEGAPMPANDGAALTITGAETGNFGEITYTEPGTWVYSVSEKAGSAAGYTYDNTTYLVTVTVTASNGLLSAAASVETDAEESVDAVIFTNTYSTGDLTVTKTVAGNADDSTKEFSFTVTLKDTSISGTYGGMTFVNGVATFTLKDGESKTAAGLPNGTAYTVSESDYTADGYVTTKSGDEGTIVGDDELIAAFTNTRNAEGSLTISKTLSGNDTDNTKDFTFTIKLDTAISDTYSDVVFTSGEATITLKGGESKTIEGLPNDTGYTVTEADYSADGYENSNPNGYTGTIDENTPAVAAFTNTRNTYGDLIVTKTVDGNAGDSTKEFSFTVTLKDTSISGTYGGMTFVNGVAPFTLKDGESKTAAGLPNGTAYTVSESDYTADGYVTTKSGDEGTIIGNNKLTASFTNTRNIITPPTPPADPEIGNLTVSKTVSGNAADSTEAFSFTVTLADKSINGTYGGMTFTNGVATFTLKGGESKTAKGLPARTSYTVAEADYSANGYVTTKSGDTGTIAKGKTATAAFINTKNIITPPTPPVDPEIGNLTVSKTVSGNAADSTKAFSFTVTLGDTTINGTYGDMSFVNGVASFALMGGESKTAMWLPAGTSYAVTEADYSADGYVTTKNGDTGTIADGKTATAAFTNTKDIITPPTPPADPEIGNLTISKNVTGDLGDKTKYFTFKVEFNVDGTFSYIGSKTGTITSGGTVQLKHGESITIVDIPAGTNYKVTESDNSGYSVYASGDTGIISDGKTSTAKFTNTRSSVPKTGDNSNMTLWFSLMGISFLGMAGILLNSNKKRRKATHLRER